MSNNEIEEIYNKVKQLSDNFKNINIIVSKDSHVNKNNHNTKMVDSIVSISMSNTTVQNVNSSIVKYKDKCPMIEFIKKNLKEDLKNHLKDLDTKIMSKSETALLRKKFFNNLVYILETKDNYEEYIQIIENSKSFKNCEIDKDFWIKVAFKADNYNFLIKKISVQELLENDLLNEKIKIYSPEAIIEKLIQHQEFNIKMENEFNLLNFIPIMSDNKNLKILEKILQNIKINKSLDFESLFKSFDNMNGLDSKENNMEYFNETMKVFIMNAKYNFTDKDEMLEILTDENKQLICKNRLNKHLNESLIPKIKSKKVKI